MHKPHQTRRSPQHSGYTRLTTSPKSTASFNRPKHSRRRKQIPLTANSRHNSSKPATNPSDYQQQRDAIIVDRDNPEWHKPDHYDYGRNQMESQLAITSSSGSSKDLPNHQLSSTSQFETSSVEFFDPNEPGVQFEYVNKPLYWNNLIAAKVYDSDLLSVNKLSDNLLERARIMPSSTTLPILLHHDENQHSDERLARIKWKPSMWGKTLRQFQYINTIIPHAYAEDYENPTATQTFYNFPLGWSHSSFQSTSIPLSLSQNSLESLHKRQLVYWNNELRNVPPQSHLFNRLEQKQRQIHALPDDQLTDLEKYVKYDMQGDWLRKKYSREALPQNGFEEFVIKGQQVEYIEMWRKTMDLKQLKLPGDVKQLTVHPWSSDMIRFDVDSVAKVISKYTLRTEATINVFIPPAFHPMILSQPFNSGGKLSEPFLLSNDQKNQRGGVEFEAANTTSATNNAKTTTNLSKRTTFRDDYNPQDPIFHPTSVVYSFPLRWTTSKFYPFAIPHNLTTVKALFTLIGVFGMALQQVPAMDSTGYQNLFEKHPVTYKMPAEAPEVTYFDSQDKFNAREAKRREEHRQYVEAQVEPSPNNGLNQKSEVDKNIYSHMSPEDIIHMVAPLYPLSQPAVNKAVSRVQKVQAMKIAILAGASALVADALLDLFL